LSKTKNHHSKKKMAEDGNGADFGHSMPGSRRFARTGAGVSHPAPPAGVFLLGNNPGAKYPSNEWHALRGSNVEATRSVWSDALSEYGK
jgi:hypothetical protein